MAQGGGTGKILHARAVAKVAARQDAKRAAKKPVGKGPAGERAATVSPQQRVQQVGMVQADKERRARLIQHDHDMQVQRNALNTASLEPQPARKFDGITITDKHGHPVSVHDQTASQRIAASIIDQNPVSRKGAQIAQGVTDQIIDMPAGIWQFRHPVRASKEIAQTTAAQVAHPGRTWKNDPAALLGLGLAGAGAVGGVAGRLGAAAEATTASERAAALLKRPIGGMREIQHDGQRTLKLESDSPLGRLGERSIDRLLGLTTGKPVGGPLAGPLNSLAEHRFGVEKAQTDRTISNIGEAPKTVGGITTSHAPVDYGEHGKTDRFIRTMNRVSRAVVLYKPGYLPPNLLGQEWLSLVHQGLRSPWSRMIASRKGGVLSRMAGGDRLNDTALSRARAASGSGIVEGSNIPRAAGHAGAAEEIVRAVDTSISNSFGKVLDDPYRLSALLHEMHRRGINTNNEISQALARVAEYHHNVQSGHLRGDKIPPAIHDTLAAARRSNRAMIDFQRLGPTGRKLQRYLFFVPWLKGATMYGVQFAVEHPVQAALWAMVGAEGARNTGIGPRPGFMSGSFKVGERNVPGLGRVPVTSNPISATILSQPIQLGHEAAALAGLEPVTSFNDPAQNLTPLMTTAMAVLLRVDPFTKRSLQSEKTWTIVKQQLEGLAPEKTLYDRLTNPPQNKAQRVLYPYNKSEALDQWLFGTGAGRATNPVVQQSRYRSEQQAITPRADKPLQSVEWLQQDLRGKLAAIGLPPDALDNPVLKRSFDAVLETKKAQVDIGNRYKDLARNENGTYTPQANLAALVLAGSRYENGGKPLVPPAIVDKLIGNILKLDKKAAAELRKGVTSEGGALYPLTVYRRELNRYIKVANETSDQRKLPYANGGAPLKAVR